MSELSIFIDESGDFGTYDIRSPYYIITMVFHDQSCDISEPIAKLRRDLSNLGIDPDHYVHTGPIIRREKEYEFFRNPILIFYDNTLFLKDKIDRC